MKRSPTTPFADNVVTLPQTASRLSEHLLREQFSAALQPRIDLHSKLLYGFEVFARWQHPQYGYIAPAQFIHIAEKQALIDQLTLHVVEQGLQMFQPYNQQNNLKLSVNISPVTFSHSDFFIALHSLCERYGIQPQQIILDFSESVVREEFSRFEPLLRQSHEHGFLMALDDFGTAESTAVDIQRMEIHELKLDQSIVKYFTESREARMLAQAAIKIASSLDALVTAECVENKETLDQAVALGCDLAQGYYLGPPMFADELAQWYRDYQKNLFDY